MIIGLQGYAGSGKSTVANYLAERHGFARRHIKAPLADMTRVLIAHAYPDFTTDEINEFIDGAFKRHPMATFNGRTPTDIQQFLGTEFGRNFIHPDLWLDIWHRWALQQPGHVVQESVRFANEAERCDVIWEIRRPGYEALNGHSSEALPVEWPNVALHNTGDLQNLYDQIDRLLE